MTNNSIPPDSRQEAFLNSLGQEIKILAREFGFADCGITGVDLGEHPAYLKKWLAAGYEGGMQWMHNHLDKRCDPALLEPGTLSVITLRMDYLPPETEAVKVLANSEKAYVSRYAVGRDYRKLIRKRLGQMAKRINQYLEDHPDLREAFPAFQSRAFTDSAPILERALAQRGGLGWIGKNCMLITPKAGSWFFLGEIYLNLPLPVDAPFNRDHCGQCSACHTACPTDAFVANGVLDAKRCISYLTIEHKGPVDEDLRPGLGNRIYGCDDCLAVCPWNKFAVAAREVKYHARPDLVAPPLAELAALDDAGFRARFSGSPIKRIGHDRFIRNVLYAIGNSGDPALRGVAQARCEDADAAVRDAARWAVMRLSDTTVSSE